MPVELVRGVSTPYDTPEEALDAITSETNDYLARCGDARIDGVSHQILTVTGHRQGPPGILGTRKTRPVQQYVATVVMAIRHSAR